ncbi:hypothetical protein D3C83_167160 [compost metagenome]
MGEGTCSTFALDAQKAVVREIVMSDANEVCQRFRSRTRANLGRHAIHRRCRA